MEQKVVEKLTEEQAIDFVNSKAEELTKRLGIQVLPLLMEHNNDWVFGYFKAPTRMQIMSVLGKAGADPLFSGMDLLTYNILKNESDPKFLSDNAAFDEINIGAYLAAYKASQKVAYNLAEKKTGK